MTVLNNYLFFSGNCKEAFEFYKSIFGGEFSEINYFRDMPASDDYTISEKYLDQVMHVTFPIGESILMGSDTIEEESGPIRVGNNFCISIDIDSKDRADELFNGLSEKGIITMPMNETFWGSYFRFFYRQVWRELDGIIQPGKAGIIYLLSL